MTKTDFWSLKIWVFVAQLLGLLAVVLTGLWMGLFRGGFAWQENPSIEFNYHPLFMVIGMVYLYSNSILAYRVFRGCNKLCIKVLHAALHVAALIFAGVGIKAVFDSHNLVDPPLSNMYSLHSWIGIITVVLFGLQWLFGFVTFLAPGLSAELRGIYKPTHVFWGIAIFLMAIASVLTGITENELLNNDDYSAKNDEGILGNCLGLVLVVLAVVIGYILTNSAYQLRTPLEEEQIHLTNPQKMLN